MPVGGAPFDRLHAGGQFIMRRDTIAALSLDQGGERPALSLYLNVGAKDYALRGRHTRLERVRMAANLRHATHDALNAAFEGGRAQGALGLPFEEELHTLWRLALALEASRGKPSVNTANLDFVFRVEEGRVAIEARKRGAPLDKLVSELMILANTTWGELLAERDVAAIYRVQASGKVRMSVQPMPKAWGRDLRLVSLACAATSIGSTVFSSAAALRGSARVAATPQRCCLRCALSSSPRALRRLYHRARNPTVAALARAGACPSMPTERCCGKGTHRPGCRRCGALPSCGTEPGSRCGWRLCAIPIERSVASWVRVRFAHFLPDGRGAQKPGCGAREQTALRPIKG